ncbi:MAG: hypothetical protein KIT31_42750, partial [Deltaproteobacteria bacterium]|nr:hypothetical protein [Deltaproteobacteria bacterium]
MPWEPLLDGDLADDAIVAAREIALEIAEAAGDATAAERTLYWAYTASVIDEPFAAAAYEAALEALVADLQRGAQHPGLYNNGLAGMGWALCHVLDADAPEARSALEVIDEALVRVVAVERWRGHHDLVQGLAGLGVYFLERLAAGPAPIALDGLHRVVAHLDALATHGELGATWLTPRALLPEHHRDAWPEGHFDCGLAHGVAGAIAFLARAAEVADAPPRARALCDEAVRWISAQRQAPDPSGRFPGMTFAGAGEDRTRAAWCYGDPGVASALWIASRGGE